MSDRLGLCGHGTWQLTEAGRVVAAGVFTNLLTRVGDQLYGEAGAGLVSAPPTGMRLGTDGSQPAKTGTGSTIGAYLTGSARAFDATPTSSLVGAIRRISYVTTWPAGTATASGITEVVLTNESPLADVAGTAANTVARALLRPAVDKAAGQALDITWHHDVGGS